MNTQYPDAVRIYDNMAIAAARHNSGFGGAFRVRVLGEALDAEGRGKVRRDDLRAFVLSLGVTPKTWERWIKDARDCGFVNDVQSADGNWWLILLSAGKVAAIMGCKKVGSRLSVPATWLIGRDWGAYMLGAWLHGKQISQRATKELTGVPVRTLANRVAKAQPIITKNIAKSNIPAKFMNLVDYREFSGRRTAFATREGFLAWRLPNKYEMPGVVICGKGRAKKANDEIQNANREGSLFLERALTNDESSDEGYNGPVRVFCETKKQQQRTEKNIRQGTYSANDAYFCTGQKDRSGNMVWEHVPTPHFSL